MIVKKQRMMAIKKEKDYFEEILKSIMYKKLIDQSNYYTLSTYDKIRKFVDHDIINSSIPEHEIDLLYHIKPKLMHDQNVAIGTYALNAATVIGYDTYDKKIILEDQLTEKEIASHHYWYLNHDIGTINLYCDFKTLFCFCYYLDYHDLQQFEKIMSALIYADLTNINQYSLIGAVMLSKANIKLQKYFIHQLLTNRVIITNKDLELQEYILYEKLLKLPFILVYQFNLVDDIHQYIIQLCIKCFLDDYMIDI